MRLSVSTVSEQTDKRTDRKVKVEGPKIMIYALISKNRLLSIEGTFESDWLASSMFKAHVYTQSTFWYSILNFEYIFYNIQVQNILCGTLSVFRVSESNVNKTNLKKNLFHPDIALFIKMVFANPFQLWFFIQNKRGQGNPYF